MVIFPLLFYLGCFFLLTFPLLFKFSSHFYAARIDGFQNIWNIWWVNKAITELHILPWHTTYLHFPYGTTLLGHTLNLFNGIMGIGLLKLFSIIQTYNFLVIFSFISSGITMFYLAYYFTRSYPGSIIAGYIFTFSNYHFSHAAGHLNLVALEWVPLFILFWFMFLFNPRFLTAILSSLTLFLVILCDYYYFFYSCLSALIIFLWFIFFSNRKFFFQFRKKYLIHLITFVLIFLLTSGMVIFSVYKSNLQDPFIGGHKAEVYSLDLLAPFVPGGNWRFASYTQFFWRRLPGNISESSVHLGLAVTFILIYVFIKKSELKNRSINIWFCLMLIFAILALGPRLRIFGSEILHIPLPYSLLTTIIPPLKLSGVPVRMVAISILSASVICAYGFKLLIRGKKYIVLSVLLLIIAIEYLPAPLHHRKNPIPSYIKFLKELPGEKGVIDWRNNAPRAMYFQTIHEKPIAFGYISRWTRKLKANKIAITELVKEDRYDILRDDYLFQYIITAPSINITSKYLSLEVIYIDKQAKIYSLGDNGKR
jgi:hypothetical protein